jgi:ABC-type sugar transport system ATPase subunit
VAVVEGVELVRTFPGVRAINGVNISCSPGRILALVGENGAGKTTLCNVIGGVLRPESGQMFVSGAPVGIRSPKHARLLGIGFVHQETTLLPQLTVGENIMLDREPTHFGLIRQRELHAQAERVLRQITDQIDVDEMTYRLPPSSLQMVEIAKACSCEPRLLILDEPTSSLSTMEAERLFAMLRALRAHETSVLFISHRLDEVFAVADDVMVMKDGEVVATRAARELSRDEVIGLMVGRKMTQAFPPRGTATPGPAVLELRGIDIRGRVRDVSLSIGPGEIVGVGGLNGQGQRDLVRALFGLVPIDRGEIRVADHPQKLRSPAEAMAAGIAFVSDDRKGEGLVPAMSVGDNIALSSLAEISRLGIINRNHERMRVEQFVTSLDIHVTSLDQKVRTLSGGNQQKVVFAKWLLTEPRVLVLDEPTRGIDVETKLQIYSLLRRLANQGHAVLLISSDMLELIGCSDRIYVMYEGRLVGSVPGAEATEELLMRLSSGFAADGHAT